MPENDHRAVKTLKEIAAKIEAQQKALLREVLKTKSLMVAREATDSGKAEINTIDEKSPAWPPTFTFSWEREAGNLRGSRNDYAILAFYQPPNLSDEKWWEIIRGSNSPEEFDSWMDLPITDPGWLTMVRRCNMLAGVNYLGGKVFWPSLKRNTRAPDYLREWLLTESGGELWETTLAWAVPALVTVVGQLRTFEAVMGNTVLHPGQPDDARPSCHIHMAFRRPASMSFEQRTKWAANMSQLAALLNDYACLQQYTEAIDHPFLGPYPEYDVRCLGALLLQSCIKRGSNLPNPPDGAIETTHNGSNYGPYKYGATSFRNVYRSNDSGDDYDTEIIGFEFRAWNWLSELIPHIARVQETISSTKFFINGEPMSLGGMGRKYTANQLREFFHASAATIELLSSGSSAEKDAAMYILSAIDSYEGFPPIQRLRDHELLLRCLFALLKWHEHPAVPEDSGLAEQRDELINDLATYLEYLGLEPPLVECLLEGRELERANYVRAHPWKALQERIRLWAQKAEVWKFF